MLKFDLCLVIMYLMIDGSTLAHKNNLDEAIIKLDKEGTNNVYFLTIY